MTSPVDGAVPARVALHQQHFGGVEHRTDRPVAQRVHEVRERARPLGARDRDVSGEVAVVRFVTERLGRALHRVGQPRQLVRALVEPDPHHRRA